MSKITTLDLTRKKNAGEKIVVVTAYDWSSAQLVDRAGADAILVGDSLGMVVQGHGTTIPVTVDHMVYHTACVTRAKPNALVVADLPFGTFQRGAAATLDASLRLVQEGGAEAIKIEGAGDRLAGIERVAAADIPVWGHLGLTPQSVHAFGGFRVQGKDDEAAAKLRQRARQIESAGATVLVLEAIPWDLAQEITEASGIPTIGIGAGVHCDGQVLVYHDVLGYFDDFVPKFVKRYMEGGATIVEALSQFAAEVRDGTFPTDDHSYGAPRKRRARKS